MAKIRETKAVCKACGNVWYYGKTDEIRVFGEQMEDLGKDLTCCCCSGCLPRSNVKDIVNKCPNCGSKAITKQQIEHEV
jgi:DNA-directed RNA polymerase beta' subunit